MKPTAATTENLDGLLKKIREEGVEQANREAEAIQTKAREEAERLVREGREKADQMVREAEERIKKTERTSQQAMEQAARDWILRVRSELTERLNRLIARACHDQLTGSTLEELIIRVATAWMQQNGHQPLEVLLNQEDRDRLSESFLARLQSELKGGVELKVDPALKRGFRLKHQTGSMQLDFSDEALAEALADLVTPRFAHLFDPSKTTQS
jgi:V/A-type H+-transporting ATPase subunit E